MPLVSIADLNGPREEVDFRIRQATELSDLYDTFINEEEDGKDRAPGIHASELFPCERKVVYSLTNVEKRPRVMKYWRQRFKMGQAIHSMVQADFHRMAKVRAKKLALSAAHNYAKLRDLYMEFEDEVKIAPDKQAIAAHYKIYSACDGVFTFRETIDGPPVLRIALEIKSEAMDGYEKLKEPKDEHVRQAHLYMGTLDIPLTWFFYMNKNNQNNTNSKHPFLIPFQTEVWNELAARMTSVLEHAKNGTLPERHEFVGCEFCPWNWTCQPSNKQAIYGQHTPRVTRKETIRG